MSVLKDKVILITGGTGSFGNAMIRHLLEHHRPRTIRVLSRDEFKQTHLQRKFRDQRIRLLLGDVRDAERVRRACEGVDVIFHAAALKQVPVCEYNPFEAIKTNVIGAINVVDAAIDCGVGQVLNISSDKAVNPVNLYGATKLCAEKVFVHGNSYSGRRGTRLASVRYGNVIGSRGSVLPLFMAQRKEGRLTITDNRMTRFWIKLEEAVRFVVESLTMMTGGEIFVP
jgi:UDP-N-acetylglucosamine 4,6-dehydratase